ncbi:FAD-binding oxidoreductase [Variovorax rhizosphaerae]|uniref:FAD-binding oxidoreductase n=1 Tax=Variovorax rhizosphaerae TaxID=1836200 RepID=A0ABU8WFM8_9BURK
MSAPAGSPSTHWHEGRIERIEQVTPRMRSFFFSSSITAHVAGQHVDVRLTAEDGYAAQRSYSIASAPASAQLELLIEKLDDGEVSPFFHEVAQVGDTIELRGPIGGHFIWRVQDGGPLVLVAGGSGIAPLMALVRHWHASESQTSVRVPLLLAYSARTWADLAYVDELTMLQAALPTFTFIAVTTREPARRKGDLDRRIDAARLAAVLAQWGHAARHVYVCGSNRFVEAATNGLLDAGVPAGAVRTERYGGAD